MRASIKVSIACAAALFSVGCRTTLEGPGPWSDLRGGSYALPARDAPALLEVEVRPRLLELGSGTGGSKFDRYAPLSSWSFSVEDGGEPRRLCPVLIPEPRSGIERAMNAMAGPSYDWAAIVSPAREALPFEADGDSAERFQLTYCPAERRPLVVSPPGSPQFTGSTFDLELRFFATVGIEVSGANGASLRILDAGGGEVVKDTPIVAGQPVLVLLDGGTYRVEVGPVSISSARCEASVIAPIGKLR